MLYLLLTADTYFYTIALSKDDLPAFGAPKRQVSSSFEPTGDSLQGKLISVKASTGIWLYGVKFLGGTECETISDFSL